MLFMRISKTSSIRFPAVLLLLALVAVTPLPGAGPNVPFAIEGPGVNPSHFRVTAFATGLSYPVGMVELADGSLLATSTDGPGFFNSNARLLRFVDADKDGFADGPPSVSFTGLNGGITSVQIGGQLVFVTGQNKPIAVLRMGATPAAPFSLVGLLNITYAAGGWLHPHSALGIRPRPGPPPRHELFFQIGSKVNFALTTETASIVTSNLGGLSGALRGDSVYSITFGRKGERLRMSREAR